MGKSSRFWVFTQSLKAFQKLQELFNVAWQFFLFAYENYHQTETLSSRATLDDALKESVVQLRLGLEAFALRAKKGTNSRRGMYWFDGFDLVSQSVVQTGALLDKYTKDLTSGAQTKDLFYHLVAHSAC